MGALKEEFQSRLETFMEIVLSKLDEVLKKLDNKVDREELQTRDLRLAVLEERVNDGL